MLDSDGSSIVIHESADDYKTDPAGNSGARIACGVIQ
ncbi:superoxide dismutase family protein [Lysinibacillus sp. MHQ-1]|nr:superoxide dismutase family protein [Lysinibacillus sp. MHQ-1]